MCQYKVYGLCIESDIALPGVPETTGMPDVSIRLESLDDEVLSAQPNRGRRISGFIYDDLAFLVEDGSTVVIDNRSGLHEAEIGAYVMGVLMAILLRQRGYLALHACCVAKDGRAIGFVGESGWGKSTLAEFFCANGYVLLNDDILAIQVGDKAPAMAVPGYPLIKLRPDSGARLRGDFEALPSLYPGTSKRMRNVESFPTHPVPLARLFLLEKEYREHSSTEYLEPGATLVRLLSHTRVTHLFKQAPETSLHLQQCANLIRQVPILALHRVRSVERLPELFSLVEQELTLQCEAA